VGEPKITVPTVTLGGQADGVIPATDGSGYAAHFTGPWTHPVVPCAGYNLLQERLPHCRFSVASATDLDVSEASLGGVLGWWSLFNLPRDVPPQVSPCSRAS
jgi:hypothetical protein